MDQYIGKMLDNRYEILERIGTGGMAVVYKARCHRLNRLVAIKILKDEFSGDEEFRRRFRAEGEAVAMLRSLSGKWHQVMTAVALVDAGDTQHIWTSVEITNVKFRDLTEDDIAAYVATGESMDKAGAYGIQGYGALLVERIEGCYNNVVGLPLQLVAKGLRNWGINLYEYKEVQAQ